LETGAHYPAENNDSGHNLSETEKSLLPWLSVAMLVATLILMLIRPCGIAEAWFAAGAPWPCC
jgi:hypothetical protein